MISCAFVEDNNVFIQCYHRIQCKQYHFIYSLKDRKLLSEVAVFEITGCTQRNFPIKTFYSLETKVCYTFYRQGHALTVDPLDASKCKIEKITDADLGNMYLLFDSALVVRSSSSILFFKIDEETTDWVQYKKFENMRG